MAYESQTPPPQQDSILLQQFVGIKNTVTRERLAPNELEVARNIDLDDVGQPHRRRGYTQVASGDFHSLYTSTVGLYGVKDGDFGAISTNYQFQTIKPNVGHDPLSYVELADDLYFVSENVSGVCDTRTNTVRAWGASSSDGTWLSPVVNPTDYLTPIKGQLLGKPPLAQYMTYYNGRIYLASGRTIWATELYLYNYVDKTRNFIQFEDEITGIRAVSDGIYVGTDNGVWFLSGTFGQMARVRVSGYAMLPRSMVPVPPEDVKKAPNNTSRRAVLMMTEWGICVGFDGGVMTELTEDRVYFPSALAVAPLVRKQDGVNQYVAVANSGGTPASNARIGDYVDAEIRRFNG